MASARSFSILKGTESHCIRGKGSASRVKISIVVPAFNEERLISETLRHIRNAMEAFSRVDWESELIVCDNNSTDRTAQLARTEGAIVVFEPINQIARARNTGAAATTGDWLVFIDGDSRPSVGLFEEVIAQIRNGECLAGGCLVKLDQPSPMGERVIRLWNLVSTRFRLLAGSFIFCETAAFRKVGGFNEEFFASEELDLCRRLKRLARQEAKRIVILRQNPIVTSARKMQLYTPGEYFWFLARAVLSLGTTLKRRESCHLWYDGRR
jgi:glycosyltransferase involved in cell wall biosynthesis